MKKILYIIPRFYPGGAERLVLEYARHLDPEQYDVHVASCVDDGALRSACEQTHAQIFLGSKAVQGHRFAIWKELKAYIARIQPDIVHTHLLSADLSGYLAKKAFPQIRWISTLHNTEDDRPWYYRAMWKHILRHTDIVIAVSPHVAQYATDVFGVPQEKIQIIPNGIDLSRWKNIDMATLFDTKPYQLATIGRLEEQKGHRYLLDALGKMKGEAWEYHVFGDGSLRVSLEAQAKALGIADSVQFHGTVDDLPVRLAEIDLVIQPSLWEGMSLTVMEAMAAGRPVIATDAAGTGLIDHNITGYFVSSADSLALQESVASVFDHTNEAKTVAGAGRKKALKEYGISSHMKVLYTLYEQKIV